MEVLRPLEKVFFPTWGGAVGGITLSIEQRLEYSLQPRCPVFLLSTVATTAHFPSVKLADYLSNSLRMNLCATVRAKSTRFVTPPTM